MDTQLAQLRDTAVGLTLEQRRQLKIIIGSMDDSLDGDVAAMLADLGLVVKVGDTYCATPSGAYVARLLAPHCD